MLHCVGDLRAGAAAPVNIILSISVMSEHQKHELGRCQSVVRELGGIDGGLRGQLLEFAFLSFKEGDPLVEAEI